MKHQPLKLEIENIDFHSHDIIKEEIYNHNNDKIGELTIFIVDADEDMRAFVDSYRGDSGYSNWLPMDVFHSMEFDYDECPVFGRVVIFDHLSIEESLRGQGIGTRVIQEVIEHFSSIADYMVMKPSPLLELTNGSYKEPKNFEDKRLRLENYYTSRFHFQQVGTRETYKCPIIYRELSSGNQVEKSIG